MNTQSARMNTMPQIKGEVKIINTFIFYLYPLPHTRSFCLDRLYQRCCATYESASLRMFRLGRTDTIRSASSASATFVKAFDDPSKQV